MNLSELAPKAIEAEKFLKAMGNRHRLMILCELHNGETCVSNLQQSLGLSQSSLSQHLARLREDRLVQTRRESQTIYYSLATKDVSRLIALLAELFCGKDAKGSKSSKGERGRVAKARCAPLSSAVRGRNT